MADPHQRDDGLRHAMTVLEAIARHDGMKLPELAEVAGVVPNVAYYATKILVDAQMIGKVGPCHYATESGKIALAIHHGRQRQLAASR